MSKISQPVFEFGPFRLNPAERLLVRGEQVIALSPKVFETLVLLVRNSGHLMNKDDLMQHLWPDSYVEETNLAQNISTLRKALNDGKDGAKYIETVPKVGYRFIASVQQAGGEAQPMIIRERTRAHIIVETDEDEDPSGPIIDVTPGRAQPLLPGRNSLMPAPAQALKPVTPAIIHRRIETRYAQSGDVNIAYQVIGDAPLDLVFVMGWVSHLEYFWEEPGFAYFLNRLASFSRLILFDKRGTGLSDRVPLNQLPTLEQRMDDVRAVMEAAGSKRAVLCGVSEGGPMCSLFAATYPEKTSALVMIGTYARRLRDKDYPWGPTEEERERFFEEMRHQWGGPVGIEARAPSLAGDEQFRQWWATYLRMGASPGAAVALTKMNAEIDIRHVLPTVRVPTLVLHRTGDLCLRVEEGRYVAERVPGAKFVELPGLDHLPFVGDADSIVDEIEEFLTGVRHANEPDRVLATVLCTQVVNADLQDYRWQEILQRHYAYVRKEVELFRGREIDLNSNSLLGAFDGPARAIRCACAIRDSAHRLGLEIRAGVHTGECDLIDDRLSGLAVTISQSIATEAEAGEVLVSNTVRDLVAGSGIRFADRGIHSLESIPDEWRLYAVI
jgi:DNA-binding winged helix-turn-helix (wHTH) protein/pimeloyl-ACP methyl ester carboxylesterase